MYPLRIVVSGDESCTYSKLAVIPNRSKCVVFSIDGSFAASVYGSKILFLISIEN